MKICIFFIYTLILTLIIIFIIICVNNKYELFDNATQIYRSIEAPYNMLSSSEIQDRDTEILRMIRYQDIKYIQHPSLQWELDYYQMSNIINNLIKKKIPLTSNSIQILSNEINNSNDYHDISYKIWWFNVLLILTTNLNKLILDYGYYQSYHPYKLLVMNNTKIIHFNNTIDSISKNRIINIVFNTNFNRDGYQNFNIQFNITLQSTNNNINNNINNDIWNIIINSAEIIGISYPKNIQNTEGSNGNVYNNSDPSIKFNKLDSLRKYELLSHDSDPKYFDKQYQDAKIKEKHHNIAKDALYNDSKCFGLINDKNEVLNYNNKLFCESYHKDIDQVGLWDSPCQINNDCPFYQANKNYPNTFGGCDKTTGLCQMPIGIIPLGYKKYAKQHHQNSSIGNPLCYNCKGNNDKCCNIQAQKNAKNAKILSPDYVFENDMTERKKYKKNLQNRGLNDNSSLI